MAGNFSRGSLSVSDTAAYLGLGKTKVYELIKTGALPTVKIGARTLIRLIDIEALLEARVVSPSCPKGTN